MLPRRASTERSLIQRLADLFFDFSAELENLEEKVERLENDLIKSEDENRKLRKDLNESFTLIEELRNEIQGLRGKQKVKKR